MNAIVLQIAGPVIAFLAALLVYEYKHAPEVAKIRADIQALWMKHTSPAERAALAAFLKTETPAIQAALPALEGAALQSHLVGRATQFAQQHGLTLTPAQIVATVQQGIAEGLPTAEANADAAVKGVAVAEAAAVVADVARAAAAPAATAAKPTA